MSNRAWSAFGTLRVADSNRRVSLATDFELADYYTLQFNAVTPENKPVSQLILPLAEVSWSVEGNTIRRLLSVAEGNAISGTGQGVKISVFDNSVLAVPPDPVDYSVSIQLVPGVRPVNPAPPFLKTHSDAGAGIEIERGVAAAEPLVPNQAYTHLVPQNAGVKSVFFQMSKLLFGAFGRAPVAGDLEVIQFSGIGAGTILNQYDGRMEGYWLPLAPGCRSIRYRNTSAITPFPNVAGNPPNPLSIVVTPTWGIEG